MRTVFDLSLIGFACRDDSHGGMTWRVDHHKHALFNHAHHLVTLLAVATSGVGRHNSVRIKKRPGCVGEINFELNRRALAR